MFLEAKGCFCSRRLHRFPPTLAPQSRLPLPQTPPAAPHSCPHSGLRASAPRSSRSPVRPPPLARLAARGPPAPISKHDNNRDAGNNNYHQPGDGAPPEGQRSAPRTTADPRDSGEPAVALAASQDPLAHRRPSTEARPRSSQSPQTAPEPSLSPSRSPTPGTVRGSPRSPPLDPHGRSQDPRGPPSSLSRGPARLRAPAASGSGGGLQAARPRERPAPAPTTTPQGPRRLSPGSEGDAVPRQNGGGARALPMQPAAAFPGPRGPGGKAAAARGLWDCCECGAGGMQVRPRRAEAHAGQRLARGCYCGGVWPRTPPRRLPGWGPRSIALCRGRPLAPGPSGGCGGRRPHERLPPIGSPYPPPPLARPAERQGPLTSRRGGNAILG